MPSWPRKRKVPVKLTTNNVEAQNDILGVRPENIELGTAGITGKVDASEVMGSSVHQHVSALARMQLWSLPP